MTAPATAMVLAAGLGTRMRPLTDDRPKALVQVGGRALIDHMLDRLGEAGVERAVVNVHAHADRLIAHLARRDRAPATTVSDERDAPLPLETGGGVRRARPLLGEGHVWIANIDSVWIEHAPALAAMAAAWEPARMDTLLLLARMEASLGFDGPGDAFLAEDGRVELRRMRPGAMTAPFAVAGVSIADPATAYARPQDAFSLFPLWAEQAAAGRLHGVVLDGDWMHVGDPAARDAAEARLAPSAKAARE